MTAALARIARVRGVDPDAPVQVPRWRCGHDRAGNTYIDPDGRSRCHTCKLRDATAHKGRAAADHARRTPEQRRRCQILLAAAIGTCKHGHYLDETTTYWSYGELICRECNRKRCARHYAARTARRTA